MHGQGRIWIRTSAANNCILVEIADNGPGIPPQIQSRIFEPFFTTKGVGEGSGLGLDIAYRIVVQRHKGELKVVSQPGDTRFQVLCPFPQKLSRMRDWPGLLGRQSKNEGYNFKAGNLLILKP